MPGGQNIEPVHEMEALGDDRHKLKWLTLKINELLS